MDDGDGDWHASKDQPWCPFCCQRLLPHGVAETPEQREERCDTLNLCRYCEYVMDDPRGLECSVCGEERYCLDCSAQCYDCLMCMCPECLAEHFCDEKAE